MGFPDRIERVIELDRPPAEVWPALTTAEGLSESLVESGFAQLPDDTYGPTYTGHAEGWVREVDELVAYLAA